jgi:hypothetical protein
MNHPLPHAPATQRNKIPILNTLRPFLPSKSGRILELASGTGEHISYFSESIPTLIWQPSDRTDELFWGIKERGKQYSNQADPIVIDVNDPTWHESPKNQWDIVICINMIHITSWQTSLNMLKGAALSLVPNGKLFLYGPYCFNGLHTAQSNLIFDHSLRNRNPSWGVRHFEEVLEAAQKNELSLMQKEPMPANNFSLIFSK